MSPPGPGYMRTLELDHIAVYFTWPPICSSMFSFYFIGKLKVGWKMKLNYRALSDLLRMFWELQFTNFLLSTSVLLYESDAQKQSRLQGPVDLVGPDRSQEHDSSPAGCWLQREIITNSKKFTNIFSKWLLSPGKIFFSFYEKIFFSSGDFPIWDQRTLEKFEMTAMFQEIRMLLEFWEIKTTCNPSVAFTVLKGRDGLWRLKTHSILLSYQGQQWGGIALMMRRTW